jgi:3-deoxy-manno-octulosonate cytidylyltransferase (CMP-KDO synthetase)
MAANLIVIPARLKSKRLPDKPLADIAGEPMIVHVWRRAVEAECGPVVVVADDEAICEAVRAAGIPDDKARSFERVRPHFRGRLQA